MREHTDGEFPFANDFNAVVRDALAGSTLVESGCTVSDGGTNDMSLDVASGEVVVNGTHASVGSQSVTLSSADPDNPRYDLVVVDSSGTASVVAGTASSTPKAPSIPSDSALLAVVEVPAGASGVTDADIYDARAVLSGIPNSTVTQGSGSGLDADTLDGDDTPLPASAIDDGPGSGLDADTVDGVEAGDLGTVQMDTNGNPTILGSTTLDVNYTLSGATREASGSTTNMSASFSTNITGATGTVRVEASQTARDVSERTLYINENGTTIASTQGSGYLYTATTRNASNDSFTGTIHFSDYITNSVPMNVVLSTVPVSGSTTLSPTPVPSDYTPGWVNKTYPTNGDFSMTLRRNGSSFPFTSQLFNSLTTGDSLTATVSWSNVTTTTSVGRWNLYQGTFIT